MTYIGQALTKMKLQLLMFTFQDQISHKSVITDGQTWFLRFFIRFIYLMKTR